jgi:TubC N-terminal docking domain
MTALDLLAEFRKAGVELFAAAGRLRFRAPAGALTASMREAIAAHREELLALVALPDGWDSTAAADALRECAAFLDGALTDASLTPPQRSVADTLRGVVGTHAERGDSLLFSDRALLEEQFAGWRRFNAASATTRRKSA